LLNGEIKAKYIHKRRGLKKRLPKAGEEYVMVEEEYRS
jgi:hypothetical protein